jgi:hypothetical protein
MDVERYPETIKLMTKLANKCITPHGLTRATHADLEQVELLISDKHVDIKYLNYFSGQGAAKTSEVNILSPPCSIY